MLESEDTRQGHWRLVVTAEKVLKSDDTSTKVMYVAHFGPRAFSLAPRLPSDEIMSGAIRRPDEIISTKAALLSVHWFHQTGQHSLRYLRIRVS